MLALLCVVLASNFAALPAHADNNTFTLRIGAMRVSGNAQVSGSASAQANAVRYHSGHFDFGDRTGPRIEGIVHISRRNRVLFNYFGYHQDQHFVLDQDVDIDGHVVPAGSTASTHAKFGLGSLVYDYAVTETPTLSFELQIGAAWARINGRVHAATGSLDARDRENISGMAPVVGLRFSTNSANQRWRFSVQGHYVNADWGNLDAYGGSVTRINALGEYRFTPHFGLYWGYDWFRLKIDHDFGHVNANAGVDLRFKGPTAGITLAF